MQLSTRPVPLDEDGLAWSSAAPAITPSGAMRDYEARRCHVCRAPYPPFGFGPPMTRPGRELWACPAHRSDVDAMLAGPNGAIEALDQGLLL